MLTLYYVSATVLQSWRIQKVCNKIAEHLAQPSSIAFYALPAGSDDGFDPSFASSELCGNRNAAKVTDILWLHGNQHGCCLRPLQTLQIAPWISFPAAPGLLPFAYAADTLTPATTPTEPSPSTAKQRVTLSSDKEQHMQLLLEAQVEPAQKESALDTIAVRLEDYGKLIAWKMDSHLALLIETDVEHFTQLLISTFLRNNLCINDDLPLMRIESVLRSGDPQPFELLTKHLKRQSRITAELDKEGWKKHLEDLRAVSVLAHQATEFEYQKNRTEGKTGLMKPDLLTQTSEPASFKAVAVVEPTNKAALSPARGTLSPAKSEAALSSFAKSEAKSTPIKNDSKLSSAKSEDKAIPAKTEERSTPPQSEAKATPTKSEAQSELEKLAAAQAAQIQKTSVDGTPAKSVSSTPSKLVEAVKPSITIEAAKPAITVNTTEPTTVETVKPAKTFEVVKPFSPPATAPPSRPVLRRNKDSLQESKPLNVLVYSDSASARDSTLATLQQLLERNVYTIYPLMPQQAAQKHWTEQTALLVVCGSVSPGIGQILVDYFLHGGKVLSLCSDILHFILPNYRTAEVREHELVQFSYDKWQRVKMMHHIFCYQPSPVKKHFSTDSEESTKSHSRRPALVCPRSMELKDLAGHSHKLDVQVLGTEETWNTPSLLLANSLKSGGKAVFSQIHLETSPSEFESDEIKYSILKQYECTRLEIFADLLSKYLDVQVVKADGVGLSQAGVVYQQAYFLGRHESKFELLDKLRLRCSGPDNVIATPNLTMKFCGKDDKPPVANNNVLPILIHSCPDDFSTVDYFDHLQTEDIGRLVIYAPIVSSSMHVINTLELINGLAVLPLQQTAGMGRSNNQWLSPLGCAMFSLQLHIAMDSPLGSRLPLIQHLIGAAIVNTLRGHPTYGVLDISLKWPNDIYAHGSNKIGGLIVNTTLQGSQAIVNIGSGINLNNSKPTLCINDMIREHNNNAASLNKLPLLQYEQFIAMIFNEIERLLAEIQNGDFESFYALYYSLWLHSEQTVKICLQNEQEKDAEIIGIDDFGFLKVKLPTGTIETVQPDGNSFDMLKGLIVPKYH
ncbi:biotin--protein ligase isoform X1 [Drosophila persimilis]|uniref:biotin--protein ligase isoform X1 n=1 Tax=Drosophila persimilis TaxID=7234 RepID=UPI000F089EB8|nr:biotin--protein ligase isoform X1 [Drosophila persimilis]